MMLASRGVLLLGSTLLNVATALSNDPALYFGGVNHDFYLQWVDHQNYNVSVYLESTANVSDGAAIHWTVNETHVHLAVAAKATGWVGFGMTNAGGMKGADVVFYETANPDSLKDAYILYDRVPLVEDCQDWTFVNVTQDDDFIIFEGWRLSNTNDTQDLEIWNDTNIDVLPQRVIAAWGDSETFAYHGPSRAQGSIRWFRGEGEGDLFQNTMAKEADGYFDLFVNNYTLEPIETAYVSFCFNWDTISVEQGLPSNGTVTVIGMEAILDPVASPYVHHATVKTDQNQGNGPRECYEGDRAYDGFVYSYTLGSLPFMMPAEAGFTHGPGPDGNGLVQTYLLQNHYHNPDEIEGIVDNGGIRIYYSHTPREHELGLLPLGDLFTNTEGLPVAEDGKIGEWTYDCDPMCSQTIVKEPVTVLQEYFHMHETGKAAFNEQIRNGTVIRKSFAEFFDYEQTGILGVRQEPFQILPGDGFRTVCYFEEGTGRVFGNSAREEMCQSYLVYYPAQYILPAPLYIPWVCIYGIPLPMCDPALSNRSLATVDEFPRVFGTSMGDQCTAQSSTVPTNVTEAPMNATVTKAPVTTSPTEVPVTASPTEAQVTTSPTEVPVTASPTEAQVTASPTEAPVKVSPTLPASNTAPVLEVETGTSGGASIHDLWIGILALVALILLN